MTQTDIKGPKAMFEEFLVDGRFMIQRAISTGEFVFYPRMATRSGATDLEWVEAGGGGTLYAITVTRNRQGSHNVALVDLDEGVRMMSTLPGVETAPIGSRLTARIETGDSGPRVVFDLVEGDRA